MGISFSIVPGYIFSYPSWVYFHYDRMLCFLITVEMTHYKNDHDPI